MKILLDEIMRKRKLTLRQVAYMTKLPKSTISDIRSGRVIPRMDVMELLAAGLKISISDLYDSPYK